MRLVIPKDIDLVQTSVPEDDYAAWASTTSYVTGDYCIVVAEHKIYKAVQDNLNVYPPDDADATYWYDMGATNRWAMFDEYINTQTVATTSMNFTVSASKCDCVCLFGLEARYVSFVLYGFDGVTVLASSGQISLIDNTSLSWTDYFQNDIALLRKVFWDFSESSFIGSQLKVTITTDTGEEAKLGKIIIGRQQYLGRTVQSPKIGIMDFSKKDTDTFGRTYLNQGAYKDTIDFSLSVPTSQTDIIRAVIVSLRAVPAVWVCDNEDDINLSRESLVAYGFFSDFNIVIPGGYPGSYDEIALTIEGLV